MNSCTQTDSYKLSHDGFMDSGTEFIYSNMTARTFKHFPISSYDGGYVSFGLQSTIIEFLIEDFNANFFNVERSVAIEYLRRFFDGYLGKGNISVERFEKLHDLGYLPIEIKAIPEGMLIPIKVPMYTIKNTHSDFAWLTNHLETVMSCETWKASTIATLIREYRVLVNEWALKTTGSTDGTEFQLHDFSMRGMSNRFDAAKSGAAFLLSSNGTDNVPAVQYVPDYYIDSWEDTFIGTSVPAAEHMLASLGIALVGELETMRRWITESYPNGVVSVISDTLDFFKVITEYSSELKDDILNREPNELGLAKTVFRPDSGDPVDIICGNPNSPPGSPEHKGAVECLWEIFGGTITDAGYRLLHERVGLIYGDSMNYNRISEICRRLSEKGYASTNIIFGIGSYTMQYMTRDTMGMAVKATAAMVNGKWYELSKDPITDSGGMKKSAKGLLRVDYDSTGNIVLYDQQTPDEESTGLLETVFLNGNITKKYSFTEIRNRLWGTDSIKA